jgi:hypothetical protein
MRAQELRGLKSGVLHVRYLPTAESQKLTVRLRVVEANDREPGYYPTQMEGIVDMISRGLAGGARFSPQSGAAKIVSAPPPRATTVFDWELEVAGVCAEFVRVMVDHLAWGEGARKRCVLSLEIRGDRSATEGVLTEAEVLRWLDQWWLSDEEVMEDPDGPVEGGVDPWPQPPFALKVFDSRRNGAARIEFDSDVAADLESALLKSYIPAIYDFLGLEPALGEEPPIPAAALMAPWPELERAGRTIHLNWDPSPVPETAFNAAIVNALTHFHFSVAAIRSVELMLPC